MNNYNFTQSLDGLNNIEADNINVSNLNVDNFIANTAEIITLSDCNLVNCTTDTPLNTTSVVNKSYVDNNFVDRTNNLTQSINGLKTFTNNVEIFNASQPSLILSTTASANNRSIIRQNTTTSLSINNQNPASSIIFQINASTCATINNSQLLLPASIFLTTNDIKSRAPTSTHSLLSDITTGTLTISSATASNTINGQSNFTGTLLSKTNYKLTEYENSPTSNTITLTFPMSQTIALRTTPSTSNPMTVTLPTLTNNERGMVFTFNKLFDTANNLNFPVTFNTSSGQGIYSLLDQAGTPTSNTSFLSVDKIQVKLAVGWFNTTNYWIEQTDFSTFDRSRLQFFEWFNTAQTNTITLTFPMAPTIALRTTPSTTNPMTVTLPTITVAQRGQIFTFVKLLPNNFSVTFNTSGGNYIFAINDLTGTPTTNSTILPIDKMICKLAVAFSGSLLYWIEVGDYSTYDKAQNNLIYPRLAIENTFANNNIFNGQATFNNFTPISNIATPTANNHLVRKDYVDNNFVGINKTETIYGYKTFFMDVLVPNLNIGGGAYFLDILNSSNPNNGRIFQEGTVLKFQPNANYSNNYYFYCNGYPYVRFSENFTALDCNTSVSSGKTFSTDNISHQNATGVQSIYTGLTSGTINVGSSTSYYNNHSLSTFTKLLTCENLNLSYVGNADINCPNATGLNLFLALTTQTVGLFSNLTSAIVNFCSSSVFTTIFNINSRIKHKQFQYLNEVKTISGTSATLTLPLEQTIMLTSSGATGVNITLPTLNLSTQAGFTFNVIKTGSITNTVTFTASASNLIRPYGSITGSSTAVALGGVDTIINIFTLEVSAGNFVWQIY